MNKHHEKLVEDFLAKIETDLEYMKKVNFSETEQLETILDVIINYLRYFADIQVKEPKLIKGKHPHLILDLPQTDADDIVRMVEKIFMEFGIRFKRHRFQGSLPLLSAKNSTVPGLVYGRGYFLVSPSTKFKKSGCTLRIECLRENQVVRILDGKLDNLTLVYWNGRGMSRMAFDPVCEEEKKKAIEYIGDQTGFVTLDLVSRKGNKNLKAVGDFTLTLNDELILERITSLDRG